MTRVFSALGAAAACALAFAAGRALAAALPYWAAAEALALVGTLLLARLLPGPAVSWAVLLGAGATLPILWQTLPFESFFTPAGPVSALLFGAVYLVLSLAGALLGPMLLLLAAEPLLRERPRPTGRQKVRNRSGK